MEDPDEMQARLDAVEKDIEKARREADDVDEPDSGPLGYFEAGVEGTNPTDEDIAGP
jgi:hypothetical protein